MEIFVSLIYPMLCVFLPCIIYEIILTRKGRKTSKVHLWWTFIFVLYLYLCIDVAGIGTIWQIGTHKTILRMDEINLIPFSSDGVLTYLLNVIMFMPFGFLLPLLWKNKRQTLKVVGLSFLFSFLIEFCQLFNLRATDVDDLIMNTLGGVLGFLIWKMWTKLCQKDVSEENMFSEKEAIWLLLLAVGGRFFLYKGTLFC